jgi:hypothetical protein
MRRCDATPERLRGSGRNSGPDAPESDADGDDNHNDDHIRPAPAAAT